ncbi:uncharacterized protein LOC125662769 [Ostrea edulis]|uniref:uncharacterized protein LOC125662769 n=1 Tax=Ostrea edulis TaxID=37623 RepID=UPI0024AECCC3|nr:uncharacterized protein LOC125662769 [Ostrea edulis]
MLMRRLYVQNHHTFNEMAPVSTLGFVIITAILCRATTARLVRGDNEAIETDAYEEDEERCVTTLGACLRSKLDKGSLTTVTKPDGNLYFPVNYFTRLCGYFTILSDCYGKVTSTACESVFSTEEVKNSEKMSINLCRNADALDTLVPCVNDKGIFRAYQREVQYMVGKKEDPCNLAEEKIRRALRLFKDVCGEAEYITLKTVLENVGEDLLVLFPDTKDQSCNIIINDLTPDRRRRGVASSTMKRIVDV